MKRDRCEKEFQAKAGGSEIKSWERRKGREGVRQKPLLDAGGGKNLSRPKAREIAPATQGGKGSCF